MNYKLKKIKTEVLPSTADYLEEYSKEHGLSIGQVINMLVLNANSYNAEETALAVLQYMELLTRNQLYRQLDETIISLISFLLSYLVPKHMSHEEAYCKIKNAYDNLIEKISKTQATEH